MDLVRIIWAIESTRRLPEGGDDVGFRVEYRYIDGTVTEGYEFSAEATEHPIELAKDIADHVKPKLTVITLECVIGDTPTDSRLVGDDNHPQAVIDEMRRLQLGRIPVTVETDRGLWENYLIIGINDQRDANTGLGARFTLTLREFRTATAQEVEAPAPSSERNRGGRDRGRQSATEATDETTPPRQELRSTALRLLTRIGAL